MPMRKPERWYVYILQNKTNGKIYVGKARWPNSRWKRHREVAAGTKEEFPNDFFAIHGAIKKYGWDGFNHKIIQELGSKKECSDAEIFWIALFRSYEDKDRGYNLTPGGDGAGLTKEAAKKIGEAQRGELSFKAKLTEKDVIEIIDKYVNNKSCMQRELAIEYNVSIGAINDIMKRKTWTHITDIPSNPLNNFSGRKYGGKPGELAGNSKLKEKDVVEAIRLYNTGQYTYKEIANSMNVAPHTIGAIIRGRNWKHIKRAAINDNQ